MDAWGLTVRQRRFTVRKGQARATDDVLIIGEADAEHSEDSVSQTMATEHMLSEHFVWHDDSDCDQQV